MQKRLFYEDLNVTFGLALWVTEGNGMGKLSISEFIKTDFVSFVRNIWNLQDTPENWNYIIHLADEIAEKYAHSRFVEKMLLAAEDYLEEKQRSKEGENNG